MNCIRILKFISQYSPLAIFIEKYLCLKVSFYNIERLQSLKVVPTFIAANTL